MNCRPLPTAGWKGEAAAASHWSSSGEDMKIGTAAVVVMLQHLGEPAATRP